MLIAALIGDRPRARLAALAAAALFTAHPVNTEAVNALTFREDPLCLLFCLAAALLYTSWRRKGIMAYMLASLAAFALALFSKEPAIVLPAILLTYEMLIPAQQASPSKRILSGVRRVLPYAFCAAFYLVIRFGPMAGPEEEIVYHGHSAWTTMLFTADAWTRYLRLVFFPVPLCFEYPFPGSPGLGQWQYSAFLAALTGIFCLPCITAARSRVITFGLAWYILFLLPVSNIIPIGVIITLPPSSTTPFAGQNNSGQS